MPVKLTEDRPSPIPGLFAATVADAPPGTPPTAGRKFGPMMLHGFVSGMQL
jgi:hypothetical protein